MEVSTEDAKILFKDLCAKYPYGIRGQVYLKVPRVIDWHFVDKEIVVEVKLLGIQGESLIVSVVDENGNVVDLDSCSFEDIRKYGTVESYEITCFNFKPYLRSMDDMTEEEAEEMFHLMYPNDKLLKVELEQDRVRFTRLVGGESFQGILTLFFNKIYSLEQLDWYYSKHFDVRDLIGKNLAIEVNKENNPYEKID